MFNSMYYTKRIIVLLLITVINVRSVPVSPCPMQFQYENDGQKWIGVIRVHANIYSRIQTGHIVLKVSLAIKLNFTDESKRVLRNIRLLHLSKSKEQTYDDIEAHRPILYRIDFPSIFRNQLPELVQMTVNDFQVCRNHIKFSSHSNILLKRDLDLPTIDLDEEQPEPALTQTIDIPRTTIQNASKANVIDDQSTEEIYCGVYDKDFKYTHLMSGGEKISAGTWPWQVAIFHKDSNARGLVFLCTGTLISNRLVLTAAHCFKSDSELSPMSSKNILLAFGRHNLHDWTERNMKISNVEKIILHNDYLSEKESNIFDADIAVVRTTDFIAFTSMIKPICLWPSSDGHKTSLIRTNGTVVGWGQSYENVGKNIPRRMNLSVVRNRFCFPSKKVTADRVFCAGSKKRGSSPCNGDSGSAFAIFINGAWFLRGIVSAALGDPTLDRCELQNFTIFTDIVYFLRWIESHL